MTAGFNTEREALNQILLLRRIKKMQTNVIRIREGILTANVAKAAPATP